MGILLEVEMIGVIGVAASFQLAESKSASWKLAATGLFLLQRPQAHARRGAAPQRALAVARKHDRFQSVRRLKFQLLRFLAAAEVPAAEVAVGRLIPAAAREQLFVARQKRNRNYRVRMSGKAALFLAVGDVP